MTVRFRSDISIQSTGFSAWYNSFPQGAFTLNPIDLTLEAQCVYVDPASGYRGSHMKSNIPPPGLTVDW